jgi:hypothetical protein
MATPSMRSVVGYKKKMSVGRTLGMLKKRTICDCDIVVSNGLIGSLVKDSRRRSRNRSCPVSAATTGFGRRTFRWSLLAVRCSNSIWSLLYSEEQKILVGTNVCHRLRTIPFKLGHYSILHPRPSHVLHQLLHLARELRSQVDSDLVKNDVVKVYIDNLTTCSILYYQLPHLTTMERRTTAKRRHVHADLNNPDATSTLPPPNPTSSFIPTPSQTHRPRKAHDFSRPASLSIPPAYQQPFNRRVSANAAGDVTPQDRGAVGLTIRNGRKWYRQFVSGLGDALRLQSSVNIVSR